MAEENPHRRMSDPIADDDPVLVQVLKLVSDLSSRTAEMHDTLRRQYADMVTRVGDLEGRVKVVELFQDRYDAALISSRERMEEQYRRLQDELRGAFADGDPAAHRQRDIAAVQAEADAHGLRQTVKQQVAGKSAGWLVAAAAAGAVALWETLRSKGWLP